MKSILTLIAFIVWLFLANGQRDSVVMVKYTPEFRFKEGVYLNFESVKLNQPINPERIISSGKTDQLNFYDELFEMESMAFFDEYGTKQETPVEKLWGYSKIVSQS
jgi:hypothetical protein